MVRCVAEFLWSRRKGRLVWFQSRAHSTVDAHRRQVAPSIYARKSSTVSRPLATSSTRFRVRVSEARKTRWVIVRICGPQPDTKIKIEATTELRPRPSESRVVLPLAILPLSQ